MAQYLDKDGLTYFWQSIKTYVEGQIETSIAEAITNAINNSY